MAFSLQVTLPEVEYRGMQTGVSQQNGRQWMSLVFEDSDTNQISCSVPSELQGDIFSLGLSRGTWCAISIRAVARADGNSYVQLLALPQILDGED